MLLLNCNFNFETYFNKPLKSIYDDVCDIDVHNLSFSHASFGSKSLASNSSTYIA